MSNAEHRAGLVDDVNAAQKRLDEAVGILHAFDCLPEQHRYETLEKARSEVECFLEDMASNACEGSHCCGEDEYTQVFFVGDTRYEGTLSVEYNRHDKTYYYVDGTTFTYAEAPQ